MIKKHYYSWTNVEQMCVSIVNQMYTDNWRPDYIVGITRGGNVPATIISNMLMWPHLASASPIGSSQTRDEAAESATKFCTDTEDGP